MTILEHYLALPAVYRDLATAHCRVHRMARVVDTLADAIMEGFTWDETPQGASWWCDVHDKCDVRRVGVIDFSKLPPIPQEEEESEAPTKAKEIIYKIDPKTATTYATKIVTYKYD